MNYRVIFKIIIGGLILFLPQSCNNNRNNNPLSDFVIVKKDSSRLHYSKDYKQFIGKVGQVELVSIEVDFNSSIPYGQKISDLGLKLNSIKIPFHCRPILIKDTIAIITNPKLYFQDLKTLVIVSYKSGGIFNFSNGGDNVDLFLLRDNDQVSIPAALCKDKVLYEIKNTPFKIMKQNSQLSDSGLYVFDYKSVIDGKTKIVERHKIRFLGKMKYKIVNMTNCD